MSKSPAIIFVAAFFLAGCATTSIPPEEIISSPPIMFNGASSLNWSDANLVKKFSAQRAIRLGTPAAGTSPSPAAPVTTWTSLNRWVAENRISAPHRLSDTPVATYAVSSANGTMVLEIGSRDATWNDTEIQLGFAPEFIDDQVFVHGVDLQKNFKPLLSESPPAFGNRVIVIDPGHGGANVGTHSVLDGRFEKEFTLDWALRLAPLLEANGWQVFLTRTSDVDVALSNRVAFAEAHHADLFISLHFNSALNPGQKPAGLETYCLTPTGMPSTLARGPDIWSQVFPNNAFDDQNLQVAVRLQSAIWRTTGLEDRGVNRARFIGVLHRQHCPAVLIEGGYLSNSHEAKLIENPEFRQKLAQAVADALR